MSTMDGGSDAPEDDSIWNSAESAKQIQSLGKVEQVWHGGIALWAVNDDIKKYRISYA